METRRKIIKGVIGTGLVSGALPNSWMKPVVNTVVLPAHAQTTETTTPAPVATITATASGPILTQSINEDSASILGEDGPNLPVVVDYVVNSPFTLSTNQHIFVTMVIGDVESQSVDILNAGEVVGSYQTTVTWQ